MLNRRGFARRTTALGGTIAVAAAVGALAVAAAVGAIAVTTAAAAAPSVQVVDNPTYGAILATSSNLALYTLNTDHNGQSTCDASCLKAWPPVILPAGTTPTAGPGVTGVVGAAAQADGRVFLTYNGVPVYTFAGDSAGAVTGEGVAGFFVIKIPAGTGSTTTTTTTAAVTATPTTTPPPPSTSPISSGAPAPPATQASSSAQVPSPAATAASGPTLASTGPGSSLRWLLLAGILALSVGGFGLTLSGLRRRAGLHRADL